MRRAFAPAARPGRVGVEVELIPVAWGGRPEPAPRRRRPRRPFASRRPARASSRAASWSSAPLRGRCTPWSRRSSTCWARRASCAARVGVALIAAGTDPHHSCADVPLQVSNPRYRALQRSLDEHGPDGRRMMRLTASLQVCVDLLPGRPGASSGWSPTSPGPTSRRRSPTRRPSTAARPASRAPAPGSGRASTPAAAPTTAATSTRSIPSAPTSPSPPRPRGSRCPTSTPSGTSPRCSRPCAPAAATSRCATSTRSPTRGSRPQCAPCTPCSRIPGPAARRSTCCCPASPTCPRRGAGRDARAGHRRPRTCSRSPHSPPSRSGAVA